MKYTLKAMLIAAVFFVTPVAMAQQGTNPLPNRGVVIAVGSEDGNLVLENNVGFHLVLLDTAAVVRDSYDAPVTLLDLRPGDKVEYLAQRWKGMTFATVLRVVSSSVLYIR